jgi:hypothetical protein
MKFGKANEIPQVEIKCECDRFENMIRKMGVEFCCEWFGHKADSEFTKETIKVLMERSNMLESNVCLSFFKWSYSTI